MVGEQMTKPEIYYIDTGCLDGLSDDPEDGYPDSVVTLFSLRAWIEESIFKCKLDLQELKNEKHRTQAEQRIYDYQEILQWLQQEVK